MSGRINSPDNVDRFGRYDVFYRLSFFEWLDIHKNESM